MMRKFLIAAALLVLPMAPASAQWGATQWGMTLDQVLAAVPGARAIKREGSGSDVWNSHLLADAPWKDGDVTLIADFFFDPGSSQLAFVKMRPNDVKQCAAWGDALVARHGKGQVEASDYPNMGVALFAVRWTDAKTKERMIYSRMTKGDDVTYCHFIQQVPA